MYCRNCGKQISDEARFCEHCGTSTGVQQEAAQQQPQAPQCPPVQYQQYPQPQYQAPVVNVVNTNVNNNTNKGHTYVRKSRWVAFFLCLFFGYFGVHRFYVGKVGTGILWLFTCGMFCFGWFIDLIVILCGGFRDDNGQRLR